MSIDIKNWDEQIENLINNSVIGYRIITLDLSIPRQNEVIEIKGNFLQVLEIPDNPPKIEIIFNDIFEYPITIKEKEQFIYPFRRLYISNDVGQGKLKLFVGKNFEFTPYSKTQVNFEPLINKLNELLNAIQNLEINLQGIYTKTDYILENTHNLTRCGYTFETKILQPQEEYIIDNCQFYVEVVEGNSIHISHISFLQSNPYQNNEYIELKYGESLYSDKHQIANVYIFNPNNTSVVLRIIKDSYHI